MARAPRKGHGRARQGSEGAMNLGDLDNALMLDLETWSTAPNAAIAEIGAVHIGSGVSFSCHIDMNDCVRHGLVVDADTVLWWMGQSDEARQRLVEAEKRPLGFALVLFSNWCRERARGNRETVVWCHGSFDVPILRAAYLASGMTDYLPFDLKHNVRDLRTLFALETPHEIQDPGVKHSAVDDCRRQIRQLRALSTEWSAWLRDDPQGKTACFSAETEQDARRIGAEMLDAQLDEIVVRKVDHDQWRGHPIEERADGSWVYEDGTLVADDPDRSCGRCGRPNTTDGHDACLGELPGVVNACCGHGNSRNAYVVFTDGVRLAGEAALSYKPEESKDSVVIAVCGRCSTPAASDVIGPIPETPCPCGSTHWQNIVRAADGSPVLEES